MSTWKRLLSLLLVVVLLTSLLPPVNTSAVTVVEKADTNWPEQKTSIHYVQKDPEELQTKSTSEYLSLEEAAVAAREDALNRKEVIALDVASTEHPDDFIHWIMDNAFAHTGNPKEGDYLNKQWGEWSCSCSYYIQDDTYYTSLKYTMTYYTTAEQEAQVDVAVEKLLAELDVEDETDYQKVKAVYDWLCTNVTYDYDNLNDDTYKLKYTAYAALINRTAVCQGYALLFYRLALEMGVDARLISGIGNGGRHAWNIVELENYYYNLDATWDAGRSKYSYFLKADDTFDDHTRNEEFATADFYGTYPMSTVDYTPSESGDDTNVSVEGLEYTLSEDGTCYTVTGIGTCTDTDLVIPATFNGLPVTTIGTEAFGDCTQLESVTISEGIQTIEYLAFVFCDNLLSVNIPSSVTHVGNDAFFVCANLKEIVVDEANTAYCSVDGVLYTEDMTKLMRYPAGKTETEFEVPAGVACIDSNAFLWGQFTEIVLPDTLLSIDGLAFQNCHGLTSIVIPAGVNSVASEVFLNCVNLTEILVEEGSEYYCSIDGVLYTADKKNLVTYPIAKPETCLVISDETEFITWGAFEGTVNLTEIILPSGMTTISSGAFTDCNGLVSMVIPNGVVAIEENAFSGCRALTNITIPVSVTSFGYGAFRNCVNLVQINYAGTEESWAAIAKEEDWDDNIGVYTISYSVFCTESHTWVDATCAAPKTCVNCGITEGEALEHSYVDDICTVCGKSAYSVGLEYTLSEDGTYYIVSGIGTCTDTELVIPTTYNGLPITTIGSNAFCDCTQLTSVILSSSITTIQSCAFNFCPNLANIVMPNGVTSLYNSAFQGCHALTVIDIPASVTFIETDTFNLCNGLVEINVDVDNPAYCSVDGVLYNKEMTMLLKYPSCKEGDSYVVPDGVVALDEGAFMHCQTLTSIDLPETLTIIGDAAFFRCYNLQNVLIPGGVTEIRSGAFAFCSGLTSVTIPAGVVTLGAGVFRGCTNLTEILVEEGNATYCDVDGVVYSADQKAILLYPAGRPATSYAILEGAETISAQAFFGCEKLTEITIPDSVKTIEDSAFLDCTSLISIVIPNGITKIDEWAFGTCHSLQSVTIPLSVTIIDDYAFYCCASLKEIRYAGTQERWNAIEKEDCWDLYTGAYTLSYCIFCTDGHTWVDATCTDPKHCVNCGLTEGDPLDHDYVDGICTVCGKYNGSEGLSYTLSDDGTYYIVSGIGECTDTDLVILATYNGLPVVEIGERAFVECYQLTSVVLPDSITAIGRYAFSWCYNLANVNIPDGVTTIEYGAFQSCQALREIHIPASVAYIGYNAFGYNPVLEKITVDEENASYCAVNNVLYNKEMSTLIYYPASKTDSSFEVPNSVTTIDAYAFQNCKNLVEIILPEGLIQIGNSAFANCVELRSIELPSTVEWIDYYAFSRCNSLVSVTIPASVTLLGSGIFEACISLTEILVEEDNSTYCSVDGVVYTADLKTLMAYPAGRTDTSFEIPAGAEHISASAFAGCVNLMEIIIPVSMKIIDQSAFHSCTSLTTMVIPNSVTKIEAWAFYGCENLISVTIPVSVTNIGKRAFAWCEILTEILYAGTEEKWNALTKGDGWDKNAGVYTVSYCVLCTDGHTWVDATCTDPKHCVNCGLTEGEALGHNYEYDVCTVCGKVACIAEGICGENLIWELEANGLLVIDGTGEMFEYGAPEDIPWHEYADRITAVQMNEGITLLSNYAFADCVEVAAVTIPASMVILGQYAFVNCTSLQRVTMCGTQSARFPVFAGCVSLTEMFVHYELMAQKAGYDWMNGLGILEYAEHVYVFSSLGGMTESFVQGFSCANESQMVEINDTSYIMYTKGTHDYVESEYMDPTCTEAGYIAYKCTYCDHIRTETMSATGHSWDENYICTTCGIVPSYIVDDGLLLDELILDENGVYYTADGHMAVIAVNAPIAWINGLKLADYVNAYGEAWFGMTYWDQLVAATNEEGYATLTEESLVWILDVILAAGWEQNERAIFHYIGIHVHRFAYELTTAPTKTATGLLTGICSSCGETVEVTLPKLNETDYTYEVIEESTTEAAGTGRYTWNVTDYGTFCFDVTIDRLVSETDAQIYMESVKCKAGDTIIVNVYIKNNPGVMYLNLTLEYDPAVMTLVSVTNGVLLDTMTSASNIVWDATGNCTEDGLLCSLEFQLAEDAEDCMYVVQATLNEAYNEEYSDVSFAVVPATVEVVSIVYGDANGDGVVNGKDLMMLRKYMANYNFSTGESTVEVAAGADANGDGKINGKDLMLLRKYMANYDFTTGESTVVLGPTG